MGCGWLSERIASRIADRHGGTVNGPQPGVVDSEVPCDRTHPLHANKAIFSVQCNHI